MSIMSDEVNFLVYRYLQESGYLHSAFSFGHECHIQNAMQKSNINGALVPPGALVNIIQKGVQFIEGELCIGDDGNLVENLENLGTLPLIDAVMPRRLADRAESIYRLISERELAKSFLMPGYSDQQDVNHDDIRVVQLRGHKREVFSCRWHSSSKIIATGAADGIAGIWQLTSDDIKMIELNHCTNVDTKPYSNDANSTDVTSISWHPEGAWLATASALDHCVRVWNAEGTIIATLSGHSDLILSLSWNQKGNYLLSASLDSKCIVWNTEDWTRVQEFQCHSGPVVDTDWQSLIAFASCSTDKTVCVCKIGSEKPTETFNGHVGVVNCVQWDPTGSTLASCADDKLIKLWSLNHNKPVFDLPGHAKEVIQIKWSSKKILASASDDASVRIWDTEQLTCLFTFNQHLEPVNSISFHPDGNYLVSGALDGYINIWALQTGSCVYSERSIAGVFEVQWSPNGSMICLSQSDNVVKVLDIQKIIVGIPS